MAESAKKTDEPAANPRGIPYAPFIENVEDFVTSREEVESTLRKFQEMIAKYEFMQNNQEKRAEGLRGKIPEIQKTLETVQFLQTRKDEAEPIETTFEVNPTLFARAKIPPTDEVYIWLGANVMLAYTTDEAETLLEGKLATAKSTLTTCEEDIGFLREQITTMEVAVARLFNWDVVQRRKTQEAGGETEGAEAKEGGGGGSPDG